MIATTTMILAGMGFIFGICLSLASKKFSVYSDPKVDSILRELPNTNCGVCGFAGCAAFAKMVATGQAQPDGCIPGGFLTAHAVAEIIGAPVAEKEPMMAVVHCKGGTREARLKATYDGLADCRAALLCADGFKACADSCLGLGNCVSACPFQAISINSNSVAVVNHEKCRGCGKCVSACPRSLISLIPSVHKIYLACSNHDHGARVKKYCTTGCTACSLCVMATPSGAVSMQENLPILDYSHAETFVPAAYKCPSNCFVDLARARPKVNIDTKCNGCGACLEVCPVKGAISGEPQQRHIVNKEKCIGCGLCLNYCPQHAIALWGGLGYTREQKQKRVRKI